MGGTPCEGGVCGGDEIDLGKVRYQPSVPTAQTSRTAAVLRRVARKMERGGDDGGGDSGGGGCCDCGEEG